jgi:hypothetical protein
VFPGFNGRNTYIAGELVYFVKATKFTNLVPVLVLKEPPFPAEQRLKLRSV